MRLTEYLDRVGKHVDVKTFNKYKDVEYDFEWWEAIFSEH